MSFVCILTSCNRVRAEVYDLVPEEEILPLATKLNSGISPRVIEREHFDNLESITYLITDLNYTFIDKCPNCKDNKYLICVRKRDRTISDIYNEIFSLYSI